MAAKKRVKAGSSKISADLKRRAFVEAYFANGGNALQAAIAAGYAPHSAGVTGAKLLKHPEILAITAKRRVEISAALELNTERVIREVSRISFSDSRNITHPDGTIKQLHELDADTAAAVASYEIDEKGVIKYKFWDKNSALDKAAKIQGLYEKDNAQKNRFDGIPRDVAKLIRDRLIAIANR